MTNPTPHGQVPEALRLADELEDSLESHDGLSLTARCQGIADDAAAELRRLHAENQALRAGYAAARLEIESLRARSVEPTTVNRYCRAGMCVPSDTKHEPWCTAHRQPPNAGNERAAEGVGLNELLGGHLGA